MTVRRLLGQGAALAALLLLAVHAAAAPADPPAPFAPPGLSAAEEKVSTDLLALADDRFLLPNQSRGEVVAALARSGHYARAGQRHRAVGTPAVDLVEVYVRTDPGVGSAALRPFLHRVSDEDAAAGLVAGWVAPGRVLDLASVPSVREVRPVVRPARPDGLGHERGRRPAPRRRTPERDRALRGGYPNRRDLRTASTTGGRHRPRATCLRTSRCSGTRSAATRGPRCSRSSTTSPRTRASSSTTAGGTSSSSTEAIDALADAGCRVIVDDIGWTDEPFFEDGVVAAHAADAVSRRGVVYVSAAGNDARLHYQGLFRDGASRAGLARLLGRRDLRLQPALRRPAARGLGHGGPRVVRAVRVRRLELRPRTLRHGGPLGPAGGQLPGPGRERRPDRGA